MMQPTNQGALPRFKSIIESFGVHPRLCTLDVDSAAYERACTDGMHATERAYQRVEEGVPSRDAYRQVAEELFGGSPSETDAGS